jgi:hypothetical protein
MYGVEVTFNGMTSLLNFIIIYQLVQKLLGGTHRQTDDLINITFLFKESRLKSRSDQKSLKRDFKIIQILCLPLSIMLNLYLIHMMLLKRDVLSSSGE